MTVPDFRSSTGLFRTLKDEHKLKGATGKHLFDASVYKDDTSTSSFHDMVSSMSRMTKDAKPTAFHHMLATIAQDDRLLRLYTQNVDSLDTSLEPLKTATPLRKDEDGKWPRTIQLHGGLDKMVCSKCNDITEFEADLFDGASPPPCPKCEEINDIRTTHEGKRSHGIGRLRPRMVLYNEHNPDDEAIGAVAKDDLRKRPDAVIVVGTTLKVPGVRRIVREMCSTVRGRRDGVAIWMNNDLPPVAKDLENCFDIVVQGPCDAIAQEAAMRRWHEPIEQDDFTEVSDAYCRKAAAKAASVHLPKSSRPYADAVALPSCQHFNNSFRVPSPSIQDRRERTSPVVPNGDGWSPMPSRHNSIIPTTELSDGESITVNTGLLTPSKPDKAAPAKMPSLNEKLKNAAKSKATTSKATKKPKAPPKKKNVVYIKKPASTLPKKATQQKASKSKAGPKQGGLGGSFKTTKTASVEARSASLKDKVFSPSPSKLRQISNAEQQPMNPLSPNSTPSKKRAFFPGLTATENPSTEPDTKKRSIGLVS